MDYILQWQLKHFDELTGSELYDILQMRNEVFVVEQQVVYQDADGHDKHCYHLSGYRGNVLVAYCRLLAPGIKYKEASIGRVITSPAYRKKGAGKMLIANAIRHSRELYGDTGIRLSAQLYLEKFYAGFGFQTVSEVYLEDTIPHVEMFLPSTS